MDGWHRSRAITEGGLTRSGRFGPDASTDVEDNVDAEQVMKRHEVKASPQNGVSS
jgi:hypothetical protein